MIKRKITPRQIIKTKSDLLSFGKYKNKSIRDVLRVDPSYILWLDIEEIVEFPEDIVVEAESESRDDDPRGWYGGTPENWGDLD